MPGILFLRHDTDQQKHHAEERRNQCRPFARGELYHGEGARAENRQKRTEENRVFYHRTAWIHNGVWDSRAPKPRDAVNGAPREAFRAAGSADPFNASARSFKISEEIGKREGLYSKDR